MSKDEKCPLCDRDYPDHFNHECELNESLWSMVRDLQRRAEIGERAVEVLNQRRFWNQTDVLEALMRDARAAGMVESPVNRGGGCGDSERDDQE